MVESDPAVRNARPFRQGDRTPRRSGVQKVPCGPYGTGEARAGRRMGHRPARCACQPRLPDVGRDGRHWLFAGRRRHRTTTNLIGNAAMLLADDRQLQARLRSDLQSIGPFVYMFCASVASPAPSALRNAARGDAGTLIPENSRVEVLIGSAHRDREKFADADKFHLDRRPNDHVAFGAVRTSASARISRGSRPSQCSQRCSSNRRTFRAPCSVKACLTPLHFRYACRSECC